jgi:hypothetical protein
MIFVTHWMACVFELISNLETNARTTWEDVYLRGHGDVDAVTTYLSALYWFVSVCAWCVCCCLSVFVVCFGGGWGVD